MECKSCNSTKCKFVSKAEAKKKRKGIHEILQNTMRELKDNKDVDCGFSARIVGSAKRNLIIKHGNSLFDTDIQIEYMSSKAEKFKNEFKDTFHTALKNNFPNSKWTSNISTSVITVNKHDDNNDVVHYFDLAIIRRVNGNNSEINKGKTIGEDSEYPYKWDNMKSVNDAYQKWKGAKGDNRKKVKEKYLKKWCKRFRDNKNKDDDGYETSSSLFIQAVNEVL